MKNKYKILFLAVSFFFIPHKAFSEFIIVSDNYTLLDSTSLEKVDNLEMKASIAQDKSLTEYPSDNGSVVVTRLDKGMNWRLNYKKKIFREEVLAPFTVSELLSDKNLKKFKVSFKKIGTSEKIGEWDCDHYALFVKNKKVFEVWASRFSALGLPDSDVELLKDFYKKMLDQGIAPFLKSNAVYRDMIKERMIIKSVATERDGTSKDVMLVKQLSHEDFSPTLFEIPEGFKQAKN